MSLCIEVCRKRGGINRSNADSDWTLWQIIKDLRGTKNVKSVFELNKIPLNGMRLLLLSFVGVCQNRREL